ncbi:MAG: Fic family protein [Deltaproteobacteria bacterium]|jgi:Fic family protein|nr:Fic family protein [Deltaproteobacteria bacterium]MCL5879208.1 Fic family protein [Deltaproteobacteria bacterium]MDA8305010.1 Fic family protein [Deltaproteobacteria bacterium]
MTFPEVQTLLDGITVGGYKIEDEKQVLNQEKALELLLSLVKDDKFKLDKETFMNLNYYVSLEESLAPGKFRTGAVTIGGTNYIPPAANELDRIFEEGKEEILKIENSITRGFVLFGFCSRNQFFWDGNKRTARLMTNGLLMDNGCPVLNIKAENSLEFNKIMVKFYDTDDYNILLSYLIPYYKQEVLTQGFEILGQ